MVVVVASSPPAAPSGARPHPTYKEMIVQALTELRDPVGSSPRAIAKYIADHFSGLHSSHEALLSVHLRRLKSQGQLRLVSGNYFLSTEAPPTQERRGRGRPPKTNAAPGAKRGRGRPRKNPDLAPSAPVPSFQGPKRGPGRPRKNSLVPVASSASPLFGAIASPPPYGVKRGRGRPPKNALALVASSSSPLPGAIAPLPPSGVKRGRGRPRKNPHPVASQLLGVVSVSSTSVVGVKRGRGRPPKLVVRKRGRPSEQKMNPESVQSADAALTKRGPGRPRKEKTQESGDLKAAQMTEGQHEALPAQAADQAGVVQNEVEDRSLQSVGSSLTEKRGRGRPRKRPLEAETAETGVAALVVKRGRGRPRKKKNPSAGRSTETGLTSSFRPYENGLAGTSVEVSRDLTEGRPEKDEDLASEKKAETQGAILVGAIDTQPADAGCVLVSGGEAAGAPVDAGGAMPRVVSGQETSIAPMDSGVAMPGLVPGVEAAIAPMDAGAAMPEVDPIDSEMGTKSH